MGLLFAVQLAIVLILFIIDGASFGATTVVTIGLSFALILILTLMDTKEEKGENNNEDDSIIFKMIKDLFTFRTNGHLLAPVSSTDYVLQEDGKV
ncbi:MAG: hypothetical protein QCI82_00870 [Candidatus Thermoplasmatota archaeon]|nr:hypothetical protein [Candidatus Thermoplasmatota archaeon]